MISKIDKNADRKKRHARVRVKVSGASETLRLQKSREHLRADHRRRSGQYARCMLDEGKGGSGSYGRKDESRTG